MENSTDSEWIQAKLVSFIPPGFYFQKCKRRVKVETLILLARPPAPGKTKTRLIPILGEGAAARLYEAFLVDAAGLAREVQKSRPLAGLTAEWALKDQFPEALPLARWLPGPFLHRGQTGANLGQRMAAALGRRLAQGANAVLIGTDFPDLPPKIIIGAFDTLTLSDNAAVLGPARDGGYYLIGMGRLKPGVFSGIEWGGAGVFEAQKNNLEALGYNVHTLPGWEDVDEPEDLERLRIRLAGNPTAAHATRAALEKI